MNLQDFDFQYPQSLVALEPNAQRDTAKLLVLKSDKEIVHSNFSSIADFIPDGSLLILNNTKVFQARLRLLSKNGGKLEMLFLESDSDDVWTIMMRSGAKYRIGDVITLDQSKGLTATFVDDPSRHTTRRVKISLCRNLFFDWLEVNGETPLPPYIKKSVANQQEEKLKYQTVYANYRGSAAAPTAGLHFTQSVLKTLKQKSVEIADVCLHVGAGTFLPVRTESIADHSMHTEVYRVSKESLKKILQAKEQGRSIVAVGTTSFRTVESIFREYKTTKEWDSLTDRWLRTDLFVFPKDQSDQYKSQIIHALVTNFHQPKSTLFMLICSLVGYEKAKDIYEEAIDRKYRLFSYGDASLLWL